MENQEDKGDGPRRPTRASCPTSSAPTDEDGGVLGRTTGSDEPATEEGVDLGAGDQADATSDGGVELPEDAEPDLKDAMGAHHRPDADAAG